MSTHVNPNYLFCLHLSQLTNKGVNIEIIVLKVGAEAAEPWKDSEFSLNEVTNLKVFFGGLSAWFPSEARNDRPRTQAVPSRWDGNSRYFEISLPNALL